MGERSMKCFQACLALILLSAACSYDIRYDGHSVLSCDVDSEDSADAMVAAAAHQELDVWSHRVHKGGKFDVQVTAEQRPFWEKKFGCETYIEDIQEMIDQQSKHAAFIAGLSGVEALLGEAQGKNGWYTKYHRFDEIVRRMQEVAKQHPTLARFVPSIGKSNEGRDIPVVHITGDGKQEEQDQGDSIDQLGEGEPSGLLLGNPKKAAPKAAKQPTAKATIKKDKPQIWFNGGQHAREWISPATVHYMYERLLSDYKKGVPKVKKLLNKFEFVIAPVINPDGYEYSHTSNRLWRKNMSKNSDGSRGVDMNRNWNNHWGQGGASTNPRAIDYQGPSVASEPEVKAVQNYILNKLPRKIAGIDFHSYGEMILRSKGWTKAKSQDENVLRKMASDMKKGIQQVHGTKYKSEVAAGLYPTTGSTDDWMSEQGKMWGHGWTVELAGRQHGAHGFMLPASHIKSASEEMYNGFVDFAQNLAKEERRRDRLGHEKWQEMWQMSSRRNKDKMGVEELKDSAGDNAEQLLGTPSLSQVEMLE